MSYVRITVNGKKLQDGELGEWTQRQPEFVKDMIKPGVEPQAYVKAMMVVMVDGLMQEKSVDIDVKTSNGRWTMAVKTK